MSRDTNTAGSVHVGNADGQARRSRSPFRQMVVALLHDKLALVGILLVLVFILAAVLAPLIAPQNPYDLSQLDILDGRLSPGSQSMNGMVYLIGTDDQGRDLLSAVLYGLRTSILVGISSAAIALVIGASSVSSAPMPGAGWIRS